MAKMGEIASKKPTRSTYFCFVFEQREVMGKRAREWTKSNCFNRNAFAPVGRRLHMMHIPRACPGLTVVALGRLAAHYLIPVISVISVLSV